MAKNKAVYAPGELSKTRDRLKIEHLDLDEAKRMTKLLGGEIGYERTDDQEAAKHKPKVRNEVVEVNIGGRKRGRRIDIASGDGDDIETMDWKEYRKRQKKVKEGDPADDPAAPLKSNYWDRVKLDKYCGQSEFEIKSSGQVLLSMLSILNEPPDNVNPAFVNKRMNDYYKRIETLVTSVRSLLPRNNLKRNEKLKKASHFDYAIIDTLRYWNIDQISTNLTRIQTRPRNVKTADFTEIIREIYKPMYILEQLDTENHIKGAFKLLYKVLFLENPTEAKGKNQELIRTALSSYSIITRDIKYQLYPLFMKLVSNCWIPYETFFHERKNRIKVFLQVTEKNRIHPHMENAANAEEAAETAEEIEETAEQQENKEIFDESNMDEPLTEEERQKKQVQESKAKTLEKGLSALETLFPSAGWDRISSFPDLYPYFSDVLHLKKGVELIAPTDPLLHVYIFARVLEELFFGLRYAEFGVIMGPDGNPERLDDSMNRIINGWQRKIESSFEKEYLPRLNEYCGLLENTAESRTSNYAKRLLNELHWTKRLFFLPYYKFESIMPPPFQKNTTDSLYPEVRSLRRYLTAIAGGIEQGNKRGGADNRAPCDGIDNPWDTYVFQVPNPVSKRLDQLLPAKKRNNASLIFFTLAITIVLDHLLNDEDSWAYGDRSGLLFRSENGEGIRPLFGVEDKIDTEQIFKQELKKRQAAAAQAEARKKASEIDV